MRVVPESVQARLGAIAAQHRRDAWMIGDCTNEIIQVAQARPDLYPDIGEMEIYRAVAVMLNQEYSARTVRDYASIAAFYGPIVRDEFDLLPFSHFRYARTYGERWREVLEYSLAVAHENSHSPSVEFLEAKLRPAAFAEDTAEMRESEHLFESAVGGVDYQSIAKAVETLRTGVKMLALPEMDRDEASALLDGLISLLQPYLDRVLSIG
jgi:hypothetical protein